MRTEIWHITSEGGGFHFGRHGLGQEESAITMPSDSLFAALINRLALRAGNAVEAFVAPFLDGEPPFALSSTFPFAGAVRFYPVPLAAVFATGGETDAKNYKRVQYVSERLFLQLLDGKSFKEVYARAKGLSGGKALLEKDEVEGLPLAVKNGESPLWSLETRPRVTLGRIVQNSSIYFTARVSYARDCGLWFGVAWRSQDPARRAQVKSLWADLGDSGLGAERSVGFGVCQFKQEAEIDLPDAAGRPWINLSRYLPRPDESSALTWEKAAYKLVNVGGWVDTPARGGQRRRAVNLLEEGAMLGSLARPIPGALVDVRPVYPGDPDPLKHPVYRSGLALAVGWKGDLK